MIGKALVWSRLLNPAMITPSDALLMVQVVHNLHEETASLLNEYGHEPLANSQADRELKSFPRRESVMTAYSQGTSLIEVVADHAMAFTRAVSEPVLTVAPWTCIRSLIEASALACWLLDPQIDVRMRIQRSLAFRYEGLSQQLSYVRVMEGKESLYVKKVIARIEDVERMAIGLGFRKVVNRKEERTGIGQQMPGTTEIVRNVLNEEANYRLLSAVVHAHHWVLQQLSFRLSGEPGKILEEGEDPDKGHYLEKNIEPLAVAYLCALAGKYFGKPLKYKFILFGWNVRRLDDILDVAFSKIGIQR